MKNKLRLIISLVVVLSLTIVGCSAGKTETPSKDENKTQQEVKGIDGPIAEQPILLTSAGQSADVEMVKVMLDKSGLSYTLETMATEDNIGENKTLVLAIGGSSKGLGAAGIKPEDELDRVAKLITSAKEKGLKVISVHIGGEARRGELSDKFITPCLEVSDYILVVEEGNKDSLFTNVAGQKSIPMNTVKTMADVIEPLKLAFK